jgi:hypothetical protein
VKQGDLGCIKHHLPKKNMPAIRSTRSKTSRSPQKPAVRATTASKSKLKRKGKAAPPEDEDDLDPNGSSSDDGGDVYEDPESAGEDGDKDDDMKSMDSDALDDDELTSETPRKRKRASPVKKSPSKKSSPRKKKKDNDNESKDDFELQEGQELVGTVVQAPKTGRGVSIGHAFLLIQPNIQELFSTSRSDIKKHI